MKSQLKKAVIGSVRAAGHAVMSPFESLASDDDIQTAPPVFIIGAPRSGTTLLYELMITSFRFAYISNAAHRFYRTPLTATRLFKNAVSNWRGDFSSSYGHIDGWGAPNEGGWVWQRWLTDSEWTDGSGFSEEQTHELRGLTHGLSSILQAPFLNKNVMHSNRLRLMHHIWPDVLFIEVRRDILDNARSIVRAERSNGGPEKFGDQWWSVRPKLASEYATNCDLERAVAQVVGVTRDIADDIAQLPHAPLHCVNYSHLCADPMGELAKIETFLVSKSCMLKKKAEVPSSFPVRPSRLMSAEEEAIMAQTLSTLKGR